MSEDYLKFTVQQAENGFIMKIQVPEGEKELAKTVQSVYTDFDSLVSAMRQHVLLDMKG